MTATQQDVFLALLSLDSYSRGENAQLLSSDGSDLDKIIGTITWNTDSDEIEGAKAAGFSASSYTMSDGTTVIAYRGTDFVTDSLSWTETAKDVLAGWLSSFGVTGSDIEHFNLQPHYAEELIASLGVV